MGLFGPGDTTEAATGASTTAIINTAAGISAGQIQLHSASTADAHTTNAVNITTRSTNVLPADKTLDSFLRSTGTGVVHGCTLYYPVAEGPLTILTGLAIMKTAPREDGIFALCGVEETNIPYANLTDGVVNYIILTWNSAGGIVSATTNAGLINNWNIIEIGRVAVNKSVPAAPVVVLQNQYTLASNSLADLDSKLKEINFSERGSGLIITGSVDVGDVLIINITAGSVYHALQRYGLPERLDSDYTVLYYTGAAWAETSKGTGVHKKYGNLVALDTSKFAAHWFYIRHLAKIDGGVGFQYVLVLSQVQYDTHGEAIDAAVPANLPVLTMTNLAPVLLGKIIVQEGVAQPLSIESAFSNPLWNGQTATNHDDLAQIQGGQAGEHYHLTSAELGLVQGMPTSIATDQISEKTVGHGIHVEDMLMQDSAIYGSAAAGPSTFLFLRSTTHETKGQVRCDETTEAEALGNGAFDVEGGMSVKKKMRVGSTLYTDHIAQQTAHGGVEMDSGIKTDTIAESTLDHGVHVDGVLVKDYCIHGSEAPSAELILRSTTNVTKGQVVLDETTEATMYNQGALRVDGGATIKKRLQLGSTLFVDHIAEQTSTHGIEFDHKIWTPRVYTDTLTAQTPAANIVATSKITGTAAAADGELCTLFQAKTQELYYYADSSTGNILWSGLLDITLCGFGTTFLPNGTTWRITYSCNLQGFPNAVGVNIGVSNSIGDYTATDPKSRRWIVSPKNNSVLIAHSYIKAVTTTGYYCYLVVRPGGDQGSLVANESGYPATLSAVRIA